MIYTVLGICIIGLFIWDIYSTSRIKQLEQEYYTYITSEYKDILK